MMQHYWTRRAPVLFGLVAIGALCAAPAFAARWDTYNNANVLNSVKAVEGGTWCASDLGLHLYDPASNRFTRYAKATGQLASNSIAEVETDDQGNTWFGTRDQGVSVRSKTGDWHTLSTFQGLPNASVNCLEPSPLGMWVGTTGGIALFDGLSLAAVWPDGVNPSPFISNIVNGIALTPDSTYIATGNGVYVTRSSEGVTWLRRADGLLSTAVGSIVEYGGEIWCATANEVYRGGQTGTWTLAMTGLGGLSAPVLSRTESGLYAGSSSGIFRWDGVSSWQPFGGNYPVNAWVDESPTGDLFAGSGAGLWVWTGSDWELRNSSGPGGNWIQGMQLKGRSLYVATRDRGVARFDGTSWRTFAPAPGAAQDTTLLSGSFVFGLLADNDGTLWAGQWSRGITRIDDRFDPPATTQYYDPLEPTFDSRNTYVWSSAVAPDGARWFGLDTPVLGTITPLGMNRVALDESRSNYSPQTGQAMSGPQIRSITFAPGSAFELWVGYARAGVDVFTDPTLNTRLDHFALGTSLVPGLLNEDVWAVEMNGDSVWISTSDGLSRYSRATRKRIENIGTQTPSSQGAIHPLSIDAEGGVWLATSGGVFHRRPDRSVEIFTAENSPLLSNDVHSVYADRVSGDIWMGGVLGVNRYNALAPPAGGGGPAVSETFGVYPNPAMLSSAGTFLHAAGVTGPFKGKVYDVHGRVVRHLIGNATNGVLWDANDDLGARVQPGMFFFVIEAGGMTRKSRVVLLR